MEVYLPKRIEFLSEHYQMRWDKVTYRLGNLVRNGFAVYEVDGAFDREKLWEQRTLVIRAFLIHEAGTPAGLLDAAIQCWDATSPSRGPPAENKSRFANTRKICGF